MEITTKEIEALNGHVAILNRLLEQGVPFNKSYYGVFGDNPDYGICYKLYMNPNASKKLQRACKKYIGYKGA